MITLHGFAASNYYNKVKLALLEKGIAFDEALDWAAKDEAMLARSPMGKVPFITVDGRALAESQPILEYLEDAHPDHPLLPGDAMARAKVRELVSFIELHLELVARRLYPEAFFGGKVSDEAKAWVEKELTRGVAAFARLAAFSPYVAGEAFTMADCAAIVHLPLVSLCTKQIYGRDLLAELPLKTYLGAMKERPSVQAVEAGRKANMEALMKLRAG